MSEAEITDQIVQMMSLTLQGIGLVFSMVSAYVVALYYFLYKAPFLLKIGSFIFFSLIGVLMIIFTLGAFDHGAALNQALADLSRSTPLGAVGRAALARGGLSGNTIDRDLRLMIIASFGLIYVTLGYLTFFHRWTHADYTERD